MANVGKPSAKENPGASVNATGGKSNVFLSGQDTAKWKPGATFFWDARSHSVEPIYLLAASMDREHATQAGHPDDDWWGALA